MREGFRSFLSGASHQPRSSHAESARAVREACWARSVKGGHQVQVAVAVKVDVAVKAAVDAMRGGAEVGLVARLRARREGA